MTKGELKALMTALGKRTDATDSLLDSFVLEAEAMIAAKVRAMELVTTVTLDEDDRVTAGGAVYSLPPDFLGPRALFRAGESEAPLIQRGLGEIRLFAPSTGVFFYATYGFSVEFRGIPAEDSEFDLIYYARPAAMTDDDDEPLLLANHPGLYVHAGMHWYRIWSEDAELATAHHSAFDAMADDINKLAANQRKGAKRGDTANLVNVKTGSTM